MRKQILALAAAMILLLPGVRLYAADEEGAFCPSGIHLSRTDNTGSGMTVTWHSAAGAVDAAVEYSEGAVLSDNPVTVPGLLQEHASGLSDGLTDQYSAELSGLEKGRLYTYRVVDSKGVSRESGFTVPDEEESVAFGYFGDVQVFQNAAEEFEKWGRLAETAYANNPDMSFGIMGGDIVESGISTEQFNLFFKAAEPVFSKIPLFAANGNHESNFIGGKPELYLDEFVFPQNGPEGFQEEFYSFEAGPCHVTVLNSWVFSGEQSVSSRQFEEIEEWIDDDLRESTALWKIVVMHHPVYPVASDNVANAVRENWGPILERDGVSLILCGHQHVYARSWPMTGGITDYDEGITQVMGVSGSKFYSSADETKMERTLYNTANYEIIRITGETLTLQAFDEEGTEIDYAVISPNHVKEKTAGFDDVADTDWFRSDVEWAVRKGVFVGVSEKSFDPFGSMNRAMLATVLWRMEDSPSVSASGRFSDVPSGKWYSEAVEWAAEKGLVKGYGKGLFGPLDNVTREQFATILWRYAADENGPGNGGADLSRFVDASSVSDWAVEAAGWAVTEKIMNGNEKKELMPQKYNSRAEAAAMLHRFCDRTA